MSVKKISTLQGLSLSIGSIIGSGILFLPSLTLKKSGSDAILGWALIILLCIPGLFFFVHMVSESEDGIAGYISKGFNEKIGNAVPLLLLGTVILGMPSSAIIASQYILDGVYYSQFLELVLPYTMIIFAVVLSLAGINTSTKVNFILAFLLIVTGLGLVIYPISHVQEYRPITGEIRTSEVLMSAGLAFWAFAGFENLTFLTKHFQNPKKDFLIVTSTAIVLCGFLYIGLTIVLYQLIPQDRIDSTTGLLQISTTINTHSFLRFIIAAFAFLAVLINLISWTAGVANAVVLSSKKKVLPQVFSNLEMGIPRNAILLLGTMFALTIVISRSSPQIFDTMLNTVSINFLLIYLLSILAFIKLSSSLVSRVAAIIVCLGITAIIIQTPILLLYPTSLVFIGYVLASRNNQHV